jgi:hypothetical protein
MSKLDLKEPLAYEALRIIHFNECVRKQTITREKFILWLEEKERRFKPKSFSELLQRIENENGRCFITSNDHKAIKE